VLVRQPVFQGEYQGGSLAWFSRLINGPRQWKGAGFVRGRRIPDSSALT